MTFDMALDRLSDFVFAKNITKDSLVAMSRAIGLAYGMTPSDVLLLAASDAAIAASRGNRDALLSHYPEYCRGEGADYS
jgi:hypothetical protein